LQVWKVSSLEAGDKTVRAHVSSEELQGIKLRNRVNARRRFFMRCLGKARLWSSENLTKGDADLLRFPTWAQIVESDLAP
jgi:hypothetical protein